jgi:putative tryptophan/tyrosine transport system substrate-binding protein
MQTGLRRRDVIAAIGGAATWPIAARAQQRARPVIGCLAGGDEAGDAPVIAAFHRGLGELGFAAGRNVEILYRYAETQYDRLPALAADLVRRQVAVIFAGTTPAALAAKAATATIPIVFVNGADPVETGLVSAFNRPGGNVTGVFFLTTALIPKRLELLHEIVPSSTALGLLVNPTFPQAEALVREAQTAARILGVRLVIADASTPNEIEAAFPSLVSQRIGGLMESGDQLFALQVTRLVALAARYAVPMIYDAREGPDAGGLMSYGANVPNAFRVAGTYVGRILKGDKPSDLPVQQLNTRIEMVLNLRTAKALGIDPVPTATLLRATEVIE